MARKVEGQPESASSSPLIEGSACRACTRRRTPLAPRFGREAALGGSPSTGDRAYVAGLVSHPIRYGMARLRRPVFHPGFLASLKQEPAAIRVVRRGGPAVYWDGHLLGHWTPLSRPLVPIPNDL